MNTTYNKPFRSLYTLNYSLLRRVLRAPALTALCLLFGYVLVCPAQTTIGFQARQGEGYNCTGIGTCRGSLAQMTLISGANHITTPTDDRTVAVQGRFSTQGGQLLLTLTDVRSKIPMTVQDVKHLPLDADATLLTPVARALGFSSITVQRSSYDPSVVGVFPLWAQFSFGLTVAPNPTSFPARVRFEVLQAMTVTVSLYERTGTRIAVLADGQKYESGGSPELFWNGKTLQGGTAPNGTYVVELQVQLPSGGSFAESVPLVIQ